MENLYKYKYEKYKAKYLQLVKSLNSDINGGGNNRYVFFKHYAKKYGQSDIFNKIYTKYYKKCLAIYKLSNTLDFFVSAWYKDQEYDKRLYGYFHFTFERVFNEKLNYDKELDFFKEAAVRDFLLDANLIII